MTNTSSDILTLIQEEYFNPQATRYLEWMHTNPYNTFAQIKRERGAEAAEEWFVEATRLHTIYAQEVMQIALGVHFLAETHPKSVLDITAHKPQIESAVHDGYTEHRRFVAFNPAEPGYGRSEWSFVFGLQGEFPLQAIVLNTGIFQGHKSAEVTLVLPAWSMSIQPRRFNSLVFIRLQSTGSHRINSAYSAKPVVPMDAREYLKSLLGMPTRLETSYLQKRHSSMSPVLGFPGADEYLSRVIPQLGNYLTELACAFAPGRSQ